MSNDCGVMVGIRRGVLLGMRVVVPTTAAPFLNATTTPAPAVRATTLRSAPRLVSWGDVPAGTSPHATRLPSSRSAMLNCAPAAMATTFDNARYGTSAWPTSWLPAPHATTRPSARKATMWYVPAATSTNVVAAGGKVCRPSSLFAAHT